MLIPILQKQENDLNNRKVITAKADVLKDMRNISIKIDDKNRPNFTQLQNGNITAKQKNQRNNKNMAAIYRARKNTYS
jgi:competence protein ComGC